MNALLKYLTSSIGKKQITAITGLFLILYVILHLVGNLLILKGPDVFNGYAKALQSLRPFLNVIELGLFLIFAVHVCFTCLVVLENMQARQVGYTVSRSVGEHALSTRLMPYTGTFLFLFIVWHLLDFTFVDHDGPRAMVNGINLHLYGLVYNSFRNLLHSTAYILAMGCVGFHLAHGIQSFFQTFGIVHVRYTLAIKTISNFLGIMIAFGFSFIPVWVLLDSMKK